MTMDDWSLLQRGANVVFALGQIALSFGLFRSGFNADGARPPLFTAETAATPAGYAFAIWGVIYLLALATAGLQALPANADDPLFRRIGWLTAAGYALCCAWLLAARFGPVWLTVPIIVAMLVTLGSALLIAIRWPEPLSLTRQLLIVAPLAIYVGWLTAAAFVNMLNVLPGYGIGPPSGVTPVMLSVVVVATAAALAGVLTVATGANPWYVGTVLWALVAIWVRNGAPRVDDPVALTAVLAGVVLIAAAVGVRTLGLRGAW